MQQETQLNQRLPGLRCAFALQTSRSFRNRSTKRLGGSSSSSVCCPPSPGNINNSVLNISRRWEDANDTGDTGNAKLGFPKQQRRPTLDAYLVTRPSKDEGPSKEEGGSKGPDDKLTYRVKLRDAKVAPTSRKTFKVAQPVTRLDLSLEESLKNYNERRIKVKVHSKKKVKCLESIKSDKAPSPGKTFVAPYSNQHAAARAIQRIVRGGLLRMKYRVLVLQQQLECLKKQTTEDVHETFHRLERRKEKYLSRKQNEAKADYFLSARLQHEADEAQQIILFLKRQNNKLREEAARYTPLIASLTDDNERIQEENDRLKADIASLSCEVAKLEASNEHLQRFADQYLDNISLTQSAIDIRLEFHGSEHKTKVDYYTVMASVIQQVEAASNDHSLIAELLNLWSALPDE